MSKDAAKVLIIGIGNTYRGDDGAGNAVAQRLAGQVPPEATVIEQSGEGTALVEAWKGAQFVIVVDAMESGAPAGTIRRFDAVAKNLPVELFRHSNHTFGVGGAVELARTLNELPASLIVYGIEGQEFTAGERLSDPVEKAVAAVASRVLSEIQPSNQHEINVCVAAGCMSLHSEIILKALEKEAASTGSPCRVRGTGCMGLCSAGPLVAVEPDRLLYQHVTPADAPDLIRSVGSEPLRRLECSREQPFFKRQVNVVLENSGKIDPEKIDDYIAADGYQALLHVLTEMKPSEVIHEVAQSGLRGRGGAGYPAGLKWETVAKAGGGIEVRDLQCG